MEAESDNASSSSLVAPSPSPSSSSSISSLSNPLEQHNHNSDGSSSTPSEFQISEELLSILTALWGGARYGLKIRIPHALVMTILFRRDLSSMEKIKTVLKLSFEHASNLAAFAALYKTILSLLKVTSRKIHCGFQPKRGSWKWMGQTLLQWIVDGPNHTGGRRLVPRNAGIAEHPYHAAIAGSIGGFVIWGRYTSVNYQIVLYLLSRVIMACASLIQQQHIISLQQQQQQQRQRNNNNNYQMNNSMTIIARIKNMLFDQSTNTYPWLAAGVWGIVMVLFEEYPHVLNASLKRSMDEIYRR